MTTATDVQIVPATRDHIPLVAWVVMAANRSHMPKGMWDFLLGDDEDRVLRYLEVFADSDQVHWGHWSQFLVAEVDGVPAAGLMGYLENEQPPMVILAGATEANTKFGVPKDEWAAGWERAKSIANLTYPHEPGAWVVEHVATRPEFRRRGLVERLMHAILDRGRERGAKTAEIGVLIGNDKAKLAYEKAGFAVVGEVRDAEFEAAYGCLGAFTLRQSL
jgi:ribosomal protein S18 acetylase RimI-like enzyme